tara:strand:- start:67240 stop:67752 length:513 start_codon:yes stop_codon:yes gene_type:complete
MPLRGCDDADLLVEADVSVIACVGGELSTGGYATSYAGAGESSTLLASLYAKCAICIESGACEVSVEPGLGGNRCRYSQRSKGRSRGHAGCGRASKQVNQVHDKSFIERAMRRSGICRVWVRRFQKSPQLMLVCFLGAGHEPQTAQQRGWIRQRNEPNPSVVKLLPRNLV